MNKAKRKYGEKQQVISCLIPPNLTECQISLDVPFKLSNFEKPSYGNFSLNSFLNRYLAGSKSLSESRVVSRRRLALVTSNIGYIDPLAIDLASQIHKYNHATKVFSTRSITLENIKELNYLVEVEKFKGGKIRTGQSWVGDKVISKAKFIFPSPESVNNLMIDWLSFVNNTKLPIEIVAILGHNQLIGIHPFNDGNGRVGRIFLQAMLEKKYNEIIHPYLYRLNLKNDTYIEAIDSTLNSKNLSQPLHSFWQESFDWGMKIQKKMYYILAQGESQIKNKVGITYLSVHAIKLLDFLWIQPIVCEAGLLECFGWGKKTSQNAIQELVNTTILEVRRLREPEGSIIYDCPIMFDIFQKLDDLIFEK